MIKNLARVFASLLSSHDTQDLADDLTAFAPFYFLESEQEQQATVDETVQPGKTGRVKFLASWWPAQCAQDVTLVHGDIVRVVGIRDITLLIEPVSVPLFQ
jgi:hypothetical protein